MEMIGYMATVLIGLALGLIGGGGSILTMPVLVYLFHINPLLATSYSLFIVGATSLTGALSNYTKGLVRLNTAFFFGVSSISMVYLTRKFIVPLLPEQIVSIGSITLTRDLLLMMLFALLMVLAASAMIRNRPDHHMGSHIRQRRSQVFWLLIYGLAIGLVTGLLGAGGGFLLIPTLVLLLDMKMKEAVGTSLLIIALNSLIGFAGDWGHFDINWLLLIRLTLIAIAGMIAGNLLSKKLRGDQLKRGFGWFVLAMGSFIMIHEFLLIK